MNFRANFTSQQGSGWYKDTVMAPTHDELGIIGTKKKATSNNESQWQPLNSQGHSKMSREQQIIDKGLFNEW